MKKLLTLLLAAIMAVGCGIGLTACKDEKEDADLKVGIICLHGESSTYDKNFIDAFKAACQNKKVDYVIETDVAEDVACYEKATELVSQGCDIIFADSFGHEEHMIKAARENPNVIFSHATGTRAHTENLPNYFNAFANIYEGRYVAGFAAGLKLAEMKAANANLVPKVGYVGAYPYAEVVSGYTSWFLGVRAGYASKGYTSTDVTMEVQYTFSWYNELAEKNAANLLINNKNCVLISQHADSMGAPTACEDAGVPNVSYNGSTESACPNTFIISSRINWQPYYEYVIDCVRGNKTIMKDYSFGFGDLFNASAGSVILTGLGSKAPAAGTADALNEVVAMLELGLLKVFDCSTFTVGGQLVSSYLADVDDEGDRVGETEVIKTEKGITYFAESEFRSAPYFDLRIDGITELNADENN